MDSSIPTQETDDGLSKRQIERVIEAAQASDVIIPTEMVLRLMKDDVHGQRPSAASRGRARYHDRHPNRMDAVCPYTDCDKALTWFPAAISHLKAAHGLTRAKAHKVVEDLRKGKVVEAT